MKAGGLRSGVVALGVLVGFAVLLAVALALSGSQGAGWLVLGLVTVVGEIVGLVLLIVALVRYSEGHRPGPVVAVTLASFAALFLGPYLVIGLLSALGP